MHFYIVQKIFDTTQPYLKPVDFSCISNQMDAINSSVVAAFYMNVCGSGFDYGPWVSLQYELIDCTVL